jgi:hypothetical protein
MTGLGYTLEAPYQRTDRLGCICITWRFRTPGAHHSTKPNLLILLSCRLRLEASSANATTPRRRNLRANVLHPSTTARRTSRLMTHDLLATFVDLAHFGFTEHFESALVHASTTFLMPVLWMSLRFDRVPVTVIPKHVRAAWRESRDSLS